MFSTFIEIFSSLGLFLFGMIFLENQIKISAGHSFKSMVENATSTNFKALLSGFITTAIFQSSSVVTLMALSLIGAGLMTLNSAIAIIFGANIGTTVTAWIVALVGFKMDIKLLSYLFIGIGGLGSVLAGEGKWKNYFSIFVGFGLIFLGLEGMKDSFSMISKNFDISSYSFSNPYMYAILGLIITAIIQSSSASIAIAQSALSTNVISFEAATAFVVGANSSFSYII
jgi:phosphate:Na+ symporter